MANSDFYPGRLIPTRGRRLRLPLFRDKVSAGFPSPAEEYLEQNIDLNDHLVSHPSSTFFVRACGDSMIELGIFDGDLLLVDRSLQAKQGDVVIAAVDGQLTCKILDLKHRQLLPANAKHKPIKLPEEMDLVIEGVVPAHIHYHRHWPW
ncbi:translesion error-prone DNA polymerase V autoproteolytic subunit [Spongiibacter sp. KMU-158]|uniref:Translesion error-prone DNA polymerase V autoproteolytic subunit n=1 Tax=Spongiibacter pelagi TaxID=2760804 RepID=A0A927C5X7_9GAMM|nr:translesion error-prone DNA polymerase V autoproteolytic subunit [Spongiibacter pelagi]MBD2860346.1 translesion error-prone DNA polymerase V autoproteolytic subunit [Spongiibacter pelagi]